MRNRIPPPSHILATTLLALALAAPASADSPPEADAPDTRAPLQLDPAARDVLRATMREHLEAIDAVVAALAKGDYDGAAATAHRELGFPKHHQAMMREGGAKYPPHYTELAMAHHQAAEDLATALAAREMPAILGRLDATIRACTACHRAYRLAGD